MRIIFFFTLFLGVMGLLNFYTYKRFFKKLHPPFSNYAFFIPSVLMVGEVLFVIEAIWNVFRDSPSLYFLLSASVGITFLLFVVSLFYDLNLSLFNVFLSRKAAAGS
jgi:uncharacterized protein